MLHLGPPRKVHDRSGVLGHDPSGFHWAVNQLLETNKSAGSLRILFQCGTRGDGDDRNGRCRFVVERDGFFAIIFAARECISMQYARPFDEETSPV